MQILATILIGFVVGLVARFVKPGRDSMGIVFTTVLGIVGAVVATYLGQALGIYYVGEPAGFLGAVVGAVLVLAVVQAIFGRRRARFL
ncbi:MAG: GlsB/YeaQ/YmgE family stress response membrane protein [Bacteriovoracia bacterium]